MRAFTLIETVVYLGLFAIVMTGIVATAYGYFENTGRNETKAVLQEEELFILGKFNFAMSGAKTISVPATTGTTLTLTKYDTTVAQMCSSGNNILYFGSGGSCVTSGSILNNRNVTISNVLFTHLTSPEGMSIGFTVTATTPTGQSISESASITRYIRK